MDLIALIKSRFKFSGFAIRSDACNYLKDNLEDLDSTERDRWLDMITDYLQKQPLQSAITDKPIIEAAIQELTRAVSTEEENLLHVIPAFDVPRFRYFVDRKKFVTQEDKTELYGDSSSKSSMFIERYNIIYQRVLRNKLFSSVNEDSNQFKLRPVEFLVSVNKTVECAVLLGMISQLKEGKYFLEDPSGFLELDFSQTVFHDGLFTENCFVLAEGRYHDHVLYVRALGLPPKEGSELSRVYYGSFNTFGGPHNTSVRNDRKLKAIEQSKETMMVFLSDVWLDSPKVLSKLSTLFSGYESLQPTFVLMGNFLTSQKGYMHLSGMREGFKALGELVAQFPGIAKGSKFVIVPGPTDLPSPPILPRPQLPELLFVELKNHVSDVVLATNPCRILYCTQEIVICREDIATKLCRNSINFPTSKEIGVHFAKTIICQGHLVPLSLNVCPVYWDFDAALQLYPCPDLVVVGDQMQAFSTLYNGCQVANPGSFSKGEFTFSVYYPSSKELEYSQIKDTEQ